MAAQTTLPNLTQDARLYKYVRVPDSGWKYLRADYDENFLKPHSVFLPKSNHPVRIEGGYYVASDEGKWHRMHEDPSEAWRLFKLCRVHGQMLQLEEKARVLTTKQDVKENKPKVLTIGDAIESFLRSFRLKVASGGRKPRTFDAIEDILMPFWQGHRHGRAISHADPRSGSHLHRNLEDEEGQGRNQNYQGKPLYLHSENAPRIGREPLRAGRLP